MLLPLLLNNLLEPAQQPQAPTVGGRPRRTVHWIPLSPQPLENPDAPVRRRRRDDELIALFKP